MRILYFDCLTGISGDMIVGALIDAGADPQILEQELKKLKIDSEYHLSWKKVIKNGISSTKFDVILTKEHSHHHSHNHKEPVLAIAHSHSHEEHSHSHDMVKHTHHDYTHNHEHSHHHHHDHTHNHEHSHHHHHDHSHDYEHSHHHHHHDHAHRSYSSIVKMIKDANFNPAVEEAAIRIFTKIGEAEAKIHGTTLENIHFHEVGAVDSIIDIVGTAILINELKIDQVYSSAIPVGSGKIHIDHGTYPVPAPATLEILLGVPLQASDIKAELTTPTGAGVVSVLADQYGTLPTMTVKSVGYGAGTKVFPSQPNVLRVIIGEK